MFNTIPLPETRINEIAPNIRTTGRAETTIVLLFIYINLRSLENLKIHGFERMGV